MNIQAGSATGRVGIVAAALAVGATTALLLLPSSQKDGQVVRRVPGAADEEAPIVRALDPTQPLMPTGEKVSLTEAEKLLGFSIPMPSGSDESNQDAEVWFSATTGEVATRFGSDLFIEYPIWAPGQDPAREYSEQAASWNQGEVSEISGHPAWLIPANSGGEGLPPVPVVHISMGNLDVTLYGDMSMDSLIGIAQTLEPRHVLADPGGSA